jgi:hypothetical protein
MSEKGPEEEFNFALGSLEEALKAGIRSFAQWYAKEWSMTREEWIKAYAEPPPEGDWFEGHNAGVKSVEMACEHFLDEYNVR